MVIFIYLKKILIFEKGVKFTMCKYLMCHFFSHNMEIIILFLLKSPLPALPIMMVTQETENKEFFFLKKPKTKPKQKTLFQTCKMKNENKRVK